MKTSSLSRFAFVAPLAVGLLLVHASCAHSETSDAEEDKLGVFGTDAGEAAAQNGCISTDCPKPFATCPGTQGLCTTNLDNDIDHCGSCSGACPKSAPNASFVCSGGQCHLACEELFADCNHSNADGCETETASDPKNCGGCGNTCKDGDLCWRGACGCPNGYTVCGTECVRLDSDTLNCGSCGNICHAPADPNDPAWRCGPSVSPPHTKWTCESSSCQLSCAPPFGDCNNDFCGDGCELNLANDDNNCGACGHKCDAGQTCENGTCLCPAGTTRCDDECVDLQSDPLNCGLCNRRCQGPAAHSARHPGGGSPACVAGECTYVCFPGFADCDGFISNGCEVNVTNDPLHCGACGTPCPLGPGQPCVSGKCLRRDCDAGVVF